MFKVTSDSLVSSVESQLRQDLLAVFSDRCLAGGASAGATTGRALPDGILQNSIDVLVVVLKQAHLAELAPNAWTHPGSALGLGLARSQSTLVAN